KRVCADGSCATEIAPDGTLCTEDGGEVCGSGRCLRRDGSTCSSGAECASGKCVDGYCCDTSCIGGCVACDVPGLEGVCTAHAPATDPEGFCEGVCDGAGRCADGTTVWAAQFG